MRFGLRTVVIATALATAPAALALWTVSTPPTNAPAFVVRTDDQAEATFRNAVADEDATLMDLERLGLAEVRDDNAPRSDIFVRLRPAGTPIRVVPDPFGLTPRRTAL